MLSHTQLNGPKCFNLIYSVFKLLSFKISTQLLIFWRGLVYLVLVHSPYNLMDENVLTGVYLFSVAYFYFVWSITYHFYFLIIISVKDIYSLVLGSPCEMCTGEWSDVVSRSFCFLFSSLNENVSFNLIELIHFSSAHGIPILLRVAGCSPKIAKWKNPFDFSYIYLLWCNRMKPLIWFQS